MSTNRTTAGDPGESVEQPSQAALCTNNCGFFSNPGCMGMCSRCFRDYSSKQEKKDKEKPTSPVGARPLASKMDGDVQMEGSDPFPAAPDVPEAFAVAPPSGQLTAVTATTAGVVGHTSIAPTSEPSDVPGPPSASCGEGTPPRKKRCTAPHCRKRVGMMGFNCRCGGTFCESHRYPEAHSCEFDHKASERRKIAVENPIVRGDKLEKI